MCVSAQDGSGISRGESLGFGSSSIEISVIYAKIRNKGMPAHAGILPGTALSGFCILRSF